MAATQVTISEDLLRAYAQVAHAAVALREHAESTMLFDELVPHDTVECTFDEPVQSDALVAMLGKVMVTTRLLEQKLRKGV